AGVRVGRGRDEMRGNDDDDLLAEARLARLLANLTGVELAPADVLNMATQRGAAASRFGELTGVLTPGMRADLILLDAQRMGQPAVAADVTMLDLVIARGFGSDVRTVLIDGEVVLDEGTHTWIDRPAL